VIDKSYLICLWIAERFIKKEGNITSEDKGEMYYNDMVARNLLQVCATGIKRDHIFRLHLFAFPSIFYKFSTSCTMHSLYMSPKRR